MNHYCLKVISERFRPLPGENEEIVNPGNYGKALALLLKENLEIEGYKFAFLIAEDFGWWLEVENSPFHLGIIIVREPSSDSEDEHLCQLSCKNGKAWSWKKLRFVDRTTYLSVLWPKIIKILEREPDISLIHNSR